jgi:D-alanine--poly(phosphoribitol) ligase subunit 1
MIINVIEYLEEIAKRYPDRIAIEDEFNSITFQGLKDNAIKLSGYLIDSGLQPGQPVAVFMPKSVKAVEVFLAVLYAGGFYVPLDISNPKLRIDSILKNIEPKFVISEGKYLHLLNGIYDDRCLVDIEGITNCSLRTNYATLIDTDPAYLINTSGSTGTPKGVLINHRSIIDYINWAINVYKVDETMVIGNQAPFVFDNSVLDIYLMLATGAKLVLIPEKIFMFPVQLIDYLESHKINFIFWVPSIMSNVMKVDAFKERKLKELSHILFAGEVMPTKVFLYWKKHIPTALFSNLYGPTEITVDCTYIILDRDYSPHDSLPIGIPCANTSILVLNEDDELVSDKNITGELCVRGSSLSMGYYNNPQKTSMAFVQNPLNNNYPELIYRTGDLVFYNELGELMYKGRKDFQVKHMGYRIELGEIETAASSLILIDKSCVLYDHNKNQIVLIYESSSELSRKDILLSLHKLLPKYMLPTRFELIKEIPLTVNGKIDRLKLTQQFIDV